MPQIRIPARLQETWRQLENAGYPTWLAGGCVRDLLSGHQPADYDLATVARPEQTIAVFDDRPVHQTGARHGTVQVVSDGLPIEITTLRTESTYSDRRHPDQVTFTDDLHLDLSRRDFTINAMAWRPDPSTDLFTPERIIDPHDGRADLSRKRLRAVGDAETRFKEDALRIMRALRFAACLDLSIERRTDAAIRVLAGLLVHIAAERVGQELIRLLSGRAAGRVIKVYQSVLAVRFPALEPLDPATSLATTAAPITPESAITQSDEGRFAIFDRLRPDPLLRLAALLLHRRDRLCELQTGLRALRLDVRTIDLTLRFLRYFDDRPGNRRADCLRWFGRVGVDLVEDLIDLQSAGAQAGFLGRRSPAGRLATPAYLRMLLREGAVFRIDQLTIHGDDLLTVFPNLKPGPDIGNLLRSLLSEVIEGTLENSREALLRRASDLSEERSISTAKRCPDGHRT